MRKAERTMTARPAYDQSSKVSVEDGEVVLIGPDGISVSMTAEAADETGRRLRAAAAEVMQARLEGGA